MKKNVGVFLALAFYLCTPAKAAVIGSSNFPLSIFGPLTVSSAIISQSSMSATALVINGIFDSSVVRGQVQIHGSGSGSGNSRIFFGDQANSNNPYIGEAATGDTDGLVLEGRNGILIQPVISGGGVGIGVAAIADIEANLHVSSAPSGALNAVLVDGVLAGSPGIATTGTLAQGTVGACTLGLTTTSTGAITGCVTSDMRLKTDVKPIGSLFKSIDDLRPVRYRWKNATAHDAEEHLGFLAQEVEQVYPDAVVTQTGGYKGVEPNALIAVLVLEVQQLRRRVAALEKK